ncbi:MAG: hypothetical protein E7647_03450 [Ruminococcaceae bacterium]|nr:hypothetical protein [Oscillospiraceae bacterium]
MRKTISLVLVAAMLVAMFAFAPASSAATLDANNMLIEAQYFGGTTMYSEISGTNQTGFEWVDAYEIKAGDEAQGILTIDGIIEEGEWTEVVYHIDSDYAPQSGLAYGNNSLFEVPSAENTFYRWLKDGNNKSLAPADGLEFDVRFMWDEQYFYMAVEYTDADGYINAGTATAGNNWDGDAIQFRLDPAGPNAIVGGQGYNAAVDSFPYDPEIHGETDTTLNCTFPWSNTDTTYSSYGEETHSTIGNFIFSYYTSGYTDMCDASKRYFPEEVEVEVELEDGTVGTKIETQWKPADISEWGDLALETDLYITYATVYPHDIDPRPAFVKDFVTYEIALPWTLVADDYAPEAENELGFSMARFNAQLGKGPYNSYLTWGSGLTGYDTKDMPQTCGGSNCLVLSGVNANETTAHEHVFAEPTCIVPEKCECGYERGFVAGHKNAFSNESLPTGSQDGSISAECTVCGEAFTMTLNSTEAYTKYDFLETETTISDQGWWAEGGFCIQWETLDENGSRYTDETDPTGTLRQKLWNEDGSAKNSFDKFTFASEGKNVLDLTIDGQTGTYFEASSYATSYTEATDVYFTELPTTNELLAEADPDKRPYNTFFGNWFGGDGTYGGGKGVYALAGLVSVEDQWFFAIYPSSHQNPDSIEELDEYAYCYTEATAEQLTLNTWHEYAFMFDNEAETAMLFWDGELVAAATDYHFYSTSQGAILLKHNADCYITNIEVGSTGLAAARTGWTGGSVVEPEPEVMKGDLDGDGQVNGIDSNYLMRAVAGTLSIEAGSRQEKAADVNGDGQINAIDTNMLKRILAGA